MKTAILIGHGMVAATHVRAIEACPEVRLNAIVGRDAGRAAAFTAEFCPDVPATTDLAAAARAADFAILTTPPDQRAAPTEALIAAGCPILAEKPLERTAAAAARLVRAMEAAELPLGVVFQHRARAASQAARDLVARGDLGTLYLVRIDVPWWRGQDYYDEPGRGTYARDGGGVLITQAIHTIDLALSLAGPVASVRAHLATTKTHRMESEDLAIAGLTFANGADGVLAATTAAFPGGRERIELYGDNGSARLESGALHIDWRSGRQETVGAAAATGGGADPMAFTSNWHRDVIADFAACLDTGAAPMATGRDALRAQALIDAMAVSSTAASTPVETY